MSYYFCIVGTRDNPLFELEFGTSKQGGDGVARFSSEARQMNPFIIHSSLDIVDEVQWLNTQMYVLRATMTSNLSRKTPRVHKMAALSKLISNNPGISSVLINSPTPTSPASSPPPRPSSSSFTCPTHQTQLPPFQLRQALFRPSCLILRRHQPQRRKVAVHWLQITQPVHKQRRL